MVCDQENCPLCGALSRHQTHNPTAIFMILADIRLATGVGARPMLSELPEAVKAAMAQARADARSEALHAAAHVASEGHHTWGPMIANTIRALRHNADSVENG